MVDYTSIMRHLRVNKDIAIEFFFVFSRFEYALKMSGFLRGGIGRAEPNWEQFTPILGDIFDEHYQNDQKGELQEAVNYLNTYPPRRQMKGESGLYWDARISNGTPLAIWLILLIRDVRNNLFHGGKFSELPEREPDRNDKLLRYSLIVLYKLLELADTHTQTQEVVRYFRDFTDPNPSTPSSTT